MTIPQIRRALQHRARQIRQSTKAETMLDFQGLREIIDGQVADVPASPARYAALVWKVAPEATHEQVVALVLPLVVDVGYDASGVTTIVRAR